MRTNYCFQRKSKTNQNVIKDQKMLINKMKSILLEWQQQGKVALTADSIQFNPPQRYVCETRGVWECGSGVCWVNSILAPSNDMVSEASVWESHGRPPSGHQANQATEVFTLSAESSIGQKLIIVWTVRQFIKPSIHPTLCVVPPVWTDTGSLTRLSSCSIRWGIVMKEGCRVDRERFSDPRHEAANIRSTKAPCP